MRAKIKLDNTPDNQVIARKIRDANRAASILIDICFNKDLTEIYFEGDTILIPQKNIFSKDMLVQGQIKNKGNGLEILPQDKGKTVNIHLDADLVAELNEIRTHVMNKTQHDILLELFKKGLDQYNKENNNI